MDLPPHHHWTRWWLKRFCRGPKALLEHAPDSIVLYDRCLQKEVGSPCRYPHEFQEALQQLRSLRQRDAETIDKFVFCDHFGDIT